MQRRSLVVFSAIGLSVVLAAGWAAASGLDDTNYVPADHPAIEYFKQPPADPVAQLIERLKSGQTKLDYVAGWGYLPSLLKALGINVDSQMLVFSKTSFQAALISPQKPRALYFNDDAAVGFVQGGDVLELEALDPRQGVNFYTLDFEKTDMPEPLRRDVCLQCHQGPGTLGIPGILITSVFPGPDGMPPASRAGAKVTDHRSPLKERWGGWYVTGTHGPATHLGNAVGLDPNNPDALPKPGTQNITSLAGKFDTSKYLAPTSDIVALMTLEHQTRMTDLMIRVGWDARIAQHDGKLDQAARSGLNAEIEELVKYMLFVDETRLEAPIAGVSTFTRTFPERGPRDSEGRSLRDFDLKTRMFRYPLSYMIYSPAFDGMPDLVRERVYQRLYDVLTGKEHSPAFARLSAEDRRAILEILRQTKPSLPAYWIAANTR